MLSMTEMLVIGVVALVVIGPEKFPGFAKLVFRTMRDLRGHIDDLKREVNQELNPLKGKISELRRIDPEKYIDSLMEGEEEEEEKPAKKDPSLATKTPDYEMDYESDAYWEHGGYGVDAQGVEKAVSGEAEARDEVELSSGGVPASDDVGAADAQAATSESPGGGEEDKTAYPGDDEGAGDGGDAADDLPEREPD